MTESLEIMFSFWQILFNYNFLIRLTHNSGNLDFEYIFLIVSFIPIITTFFLGPKACTNFLLLNAIATCPFQNNKSPFLIFLIEISFLKNFFWSLESLGQYMLLNFNNSCTKAEQSSPLGLFPPHKYFVFRYNFILSRKCFFLKLIGFIFFFKIHPFLVWIKLFLSSKIDILELKKIFLLSLYLLFGFLYTLHSLEMILWVFLFLSKCKSLASIKPLYLS